MGLLVAAIVFVMGGFGVVVVVGDWVIFQSLVYIYASACKYACYGFCDGSVIILA